MPATEVSNLDGLFKDQFHADIESLLPDHSILQREGMISWVPEDKRNGEFYSIPTVLRSNQGASYLGDGGAVATLKVPRPGLMKEAQVRGSEMVVRGQISYKALSQAATQGARAFKKSSAYLVEDLAQVAHTRVEIAALYGQSGLGVVESVTDVGGSYCNIVITEQEFAAGLWVLLEGASFDAFTGTTKNNGTGPLILDRVTTSTRTLRFQYSGTLSSEVAVGDVLYFEGANQGSGSFYEMCGLFKQLSTVSGTLFNIDRGAYALMQGNVVANTGAITKAKIVDAAMLAVDKGCMTNLIALAGTKTFADLNTEDMALRSFDSSYTPARSQSGSRELVYESINGSIKVVCHPLVKNGHMIILNPDDVLWVGSSKPTFEIPGMGGERFFRLVDNANAVELQNYSDLAIYALKPSQTVVMTGITH